MSVNFVQKVDDLVKLRHALISVSDKTGLDLLVPGLIAINPGIRIFSTGGTFTAIERILGEGAAANLTQVSEYTGQPETQGGLVKTLDFKIYLGLLTETYNDAHQADLKRTAAEQIDLVVVNLYPFQATVAKPDVSVEMARANIDIGGPCMVRASAKNYLRVASLTDPADYPGLLAELRANQGRLSLRRRFEYARKAFAHTAAYDAAIAAFLAKQDAAAVPDGYSIAE